MSDVAKKILKRLENITDVKKAGYKVEQTVDKFGSSNPIDWQHRTLVKDAEGNVAGSYIFENKKGKWMPTSAQVKEPHRGQGITSSIYDDFEAKQGIILDPHTNQTPDAKRLWEKRLQSKKAKEIVDGDITMPTISDPTLDTTKKFNATEGLGKIGGMVGQVWKKTLGRADDEAYKVKKAITDKIVEATQIAPASMRNQDWYKQQQEGIKEGAATVADFATPSPSDLAMGKVGKLWKMAGKGPFVKKPKTAEVLENIEKIGEKNKITPVPTTPEWNVDTGNFGKIIDVSKNKKKAENIVNSLDKKKEEMMDAVLKDTSLTAEQKMEKRKAIRDWKPPTK